MTSPDTEIVLRLRTLQELRAAVLESMRLVSKRVLNISKTKLSLINSNYDRARELLNNFIDLNTQIIELNVQLPESLKVYKLDVSKIMSQLEDEYFNIEVHYHESLSLSKNNPPQSPLTPASTTPVFHVPKITVPQFSGVITDYPEWKALFDCVFTNNPSLSKEQKAVYLRTVVSGEAAAIVNKYSLTAVGFDQAYKALDDRFNSSRALASHHLNELLNFAPLKKSTVDSLKSYLHVHQDSVAGVRSLDIKDMGDFLLTQISLRNLDPYCRRLFENSLPDNSIPTHAMLMKFVSSQVRTMELLDDSLPAGQNAAPEQKQQFKSLHVLSTSDNHKNSSSSAPKFPSYVSHPVASGGNCTPNDVSSHKELESPLADGYVNGFDNHPSSCLSVVNLSSASPCLKPVANPSTTHTRSVTFSHVRATPVQCSYCYCDSHKIYRCPDYFAITSEQRLEFAKDKHMCLSCLGTAHAFENCKSKFSCRFCGKKHHSSLHDSLPCSTSKYPLNRPPEPVQTYLTNQPQVRNSCSERASSSQKPPHVRWASKNGSSSPVRTEPSVSNNCPTPGSCNALQFSPSTAQNMFPGSYMVLPKLYRPGSFQNNCC